MVLGPETWARASGLSLSEKRARFPWGTATVNLLGSLALGVLVGFSTSLVSDQWVTIFGTGLLGGYATFSTASLETVRLLHDRHHRAAGLYALGVLAACVGLSLIGFIVA